MNNQSVIDESFTGEYTEKSETGYITINYENGKKNGVTKFTDYTGIVLSEINYQNDVMDGILKQYYPSGKILSVMNYNQGILDGVFESFFENGIKQFESCYKNGEFEGKFVMYDEFGDKISESMYKNGQKHGKSISYYPKSQGGGIFEVTEFENGLLVNEKVNLYPSGEIMSITPYKSGKAQQYTKTYTKQGKEIKI